MTRDTCKEPCKLLQDACLIAGKVKELEEQIEKMKCCENCKYKDCNKTSSYQTCWYCKNKDKWKLKE